MPAFLFPVRGRRSGYLDGVLSRSGRDVRHPDAVVALFRGLGGHGCRGPLNLRGPARSLSSVLRRAMGFHAGRISRTAYRCSELMVPDAVGSDAIPGVGSAAPVRALVGPDIRPMLCMTRRGPSCGHGAGYPPGSRCRPGVRGLMPSYCGFRRGSSPFP